MDLQSLREIFRDTRSHISLASIVRVEVASDRSYIKCLVSMLPDKREIVAQMSWDYVGPESGIYALPAVGDLVLVAFADGDDELAFVIKRLTTKEDKAPANAVSGDMVLKALAGKKTWISSDERINLSVADAEPTENLVLGQVFKAMMQDILAELSTLCQTLSQHTHITGSPGSTTSAPIQAAAFISNKSQFDATKASPVDNEDVLSDLAYTEKG
jgi:uncharacterized protein involved in type VI secretion and phage assembly